MQMGEKIQLNYIFCGFETMGDSNEGKNNQRGRMMNGQETPLGKFGFLVLPFGIGLVFVWGATWLPVIIAAATGALIANVRATLFVASIDQVEMENPLLNLQSEVSGVDNSTKIKFIFMQSLVGAIVCAVWTGVVCGVALLLR